MNIRLAQETDLNSIQRIVETSFSEEENKAIMELASDLSSENSSPPIKSLVAEVDDQVIAYVSYSPIFLKSDSKINGYILAPLAVSPDHQHKGVGSKLINAGIEMLSRDEVDVLLVYGDPKYYGRFGFNEDTAHFFTPPYPLEYPFGWLGMVLNEIETPKMPIEFECVQSLNKAELW